MEIATHVSFLYVADSKMDSPKPRKFSGFVMARPLSTFAMLLFLYSFTAIACGDFYQYEYVGVVPAGASGHSMVADGETWTATVVVDASVQDTNANQDIGEYAAVVSGTLEFSGGYSADDFDFSGARVLILNDTFFADSIRVTGEFGINNFVFQVNSEDLTTFPDDSLIGPGVNIDPFPDPATFEFFQLLFTDDFGTINYFANQANNVSFSATAIPEPVSLPILATIALAVSGYRRRP